MKADDLAPGCRELERHTFLLPVWPEIATVAHKSERPDDGPVVIEAVVAFDASQVLARLQTDLDVPKYKFITIKSFHLQQECDGL